MNVLSWNFFHPLEEKKTSFFVNYHFRWACCITFIVFEILSIFHFRAS